MGPTASSALDSLTAIFQVVGVVRQSPTPSEGPDRVLGRARTLGVPIFFDVSLEGVERTIMETRPDCVVVSSYNRILPSSILDHCRFVNVHYASLPAYRGRANVNWTIINGESETAITIHIIASGLDSGNILYQRKTPVGPDDTVTDLYNVLNEVQREVLGVTVARYIAGYEGEPQDETAATYGCGRVPADGQIDWSDSTQRIYALVRALSPPYEPAHTYLNGRRISIIRVSPLDNAPRYAGRVPGRVVGRSRKSGYVDVLTGDGVLRIQEVITDDGISPASAAIESTRQTLGLSTVDLLSRIEMLEAQLSRITGSASDR
jgi:methionyl-tRNA formyltransferase